MGVTRNTNGQRGSDTPKVSFREGHPTSQFSYDSSDTWILSTRTSRDKEITNLVGASWRLFKSRWAFPWPVFSGCAHWQSRRAKICTERLISEARLLSRTAPWDMRWAGSDKKSGCSPWVLVTEQSVWETISWFRIIREGNGSESWHAEGQKAVGWRSGFG